MSACAFARSALACALLFGCGIGDTISLGATAAAPAPGGAGAGGIAGTPSGGSGGTPSRADASTPFVDAGDAGCVDPGGCARDAGQDAGPPPVCMPQLDSLVTTCRRRAAPESLPLALSLHFEWPKPGTALDGQVITSNMPLVGSFTDDDLNGVIDACDIPDVVVPVALNAGPNKLFLISGDSAELHFEFELGVAGNVVPALADLDADGTIEVVTLSESGQLLIFDHTGFVERVGDTATLWPFQGGSCYALSIFDLDGDGPPEIIGLTDVFESDGTLRFNHPSSVPLEPSVDGCSAPLAADLDGDGRLEVILANNTSVYDANGMLLFELVLTGTPMIADSQAMTPPELIVASTTGLTLIAEDTSATTHEETCMSGGARLIDIDHDGWLDVISPACGLTRFELEPVRMVLRWQNTFDLPGGPIALFDLRGRGVPDIILGSSSGLFVHDGNSGEVLAQRIELASGVAPIGPVIADVDNDGSADILLMSDGPERPRLLAVRARQRDFAPARRIYSQLANQVTYVDENGRPQARPSAFMPSHSTAQIEDGHLCIPMP